MVESTRLLRDLVSIPSVNPMGRPLQGPEIFEEGVTAYVETFFRGLGVRSERQSIVPRRANIVGFHEPPGARSTLILEAHQDTVPTDGMTIDPFGARIEDGRLYGRGACDIKGGMAAMLAAFARLVRDNRPAAAGLSWPVPWMKNTLSSASSAWSRTTSAAPGRSPLSWPSPRNCVSSTPTRVWPAGRSPPRADRAIVRGPTRASTPFTTWPPCCPSSSGMQDELQP